MGSVAGRFKSLRSDQSRNPLIRNIRFFWLRADIGGKGRLPLFNAHSRARDGRGHAADVVDIGNESSDGKAGEIWYNISTMLKC